jgi:hypothetical protein
MRPGEVPTVQSGEKVCVFFTSSQKEFVGVGDPQNSTYFKDQFEAFQALHKYLVADDWIFFIRRHPIMNDNSRDPDGKYWDKFLNYKNVKIIEPHSNIDSYALGNIADLVAHFNSSIGIQLIYQGHKSVISMGNPMWADLTPGTLARNDNQICEFFKAPLKNWSKESVLPWAYFRASFGENFRHFEFIKSSTTWKIKAEFDQK